MKRFTEFMEGKPDFNKAMAPTSEKEKVADINNSINTIQARLIGMAGIYPEIDFSHLQRMIREFQAEWGKIGG